MTNRAFVYLFFSGLLFAASGYSPPAAASCEQQCDNEFWMCMATHGDFDRCNMHKEICLAGCAPPPPPPPPPPPGGSTASVNCVADGGPGQRFCEATPWDGDYYNWYTTGPATVTNNGQSATHAHCYGTDGRVHVDIYKNGTMESASTKCY